MQTINIAEASADIAKAEAAIDAAVAALAALRAAAPDLGGGIRATVDYVNDSVHYGSPEGVREALAVSYRYSRSLIELSGLLEEVHRLVAPLGQLAYRQTKQAERDAYSAMPEVEWL